MSRSDKIPKSTQWANLQSQTEFFDFSIKQKDSCWELFMRSGLNDEGPGDLTIKNFVDCTEAKYYMKNKIKKLTNDQGFKLKESSEGNDCDKSNLDYSSPYG